MWVWCKKHQENHTTRTESGSLYHLAKLDTIYVDTSFHSFMREVGYQSDIDMKQYMLHLTLSEIHFYILYEVLKLTDTRSFGSNSTDAYTQSFTLIGLHINSHYSYSIIWSIVNSSKLSYSDRVINKVAVIFNTVFKLVTIPVKNGRS